MKLSFDGTTGNYLQVVPVLAAEEDPSSTALVASPGGGHPELPNPGEGFENGKHRARTTP